MCVIAGHHQNLSVQLANVILLQMKKATLSFISSMIILSFVYANGKQSGISTKPDTVTSLNRLYQNEYFSINYPVGYEVVANFGCRSANMEELKNMDADSIAAMPMNELNIVPKTESVEWRLPEVYVVLSRHKLDFPIRMFMDLSIYTKNQPNADKMPLIGHSNVDSISFAGYPALEIEFAYKGESGDTLVQHQIIVQKPDYSLYYINNKYNYSHPEFYELGEKILSSFKFKD